MKPESLSSLPLSLPNSSQKQQGFFVLFFCFFPNISHFWCFSRLLTCHPGPPGVFLFSDWNLFSHWLGCGKPRKLRGGRALGW